MNEIALLKQNENNEKEYIAHIANKIIKDNNKISKFLRDNFQNSDTYSEYKLEKIINKFINKFFNM
jgi:hypothetical protein